MAKFDDDWGVVGWVFFVVWLVLFLLSRVVWTCFQLVGWFTRLVLEGLAGESRIN